ncbi:MAG TPA: APC family permease [Actinotalea caeni]|uniref:APC family permease n=1 Tax=Actinotalea caeni TaxID=1348467 RepID=UPI002B4B36D2|nr:APC family permease [Actinotalea caeni]HLV55118.1 APC family permease [Actinotalea caeni]
MAADSTTTLKRGIGGGLLLVFILGDVLGAGVYALMGELAGEAGGMTWVPILVALVMALLTAGSYAELVTKYPKAGGAAVFAQRAFKSPVVAFLVGYCMLCAGIVSVAGLAVAFAGDYLATFVALPVPLVAAVFLALVAALNLRGIKESVRSNLVMTAIEVTGLVLVVVVAAVALAGGTGDIGRVMEAPAVDAPVLALLGAALLAFYSFVGFETSANVAEEVKDVSRVYPRALFGALLAAGAVYLLVALGSSALLAPEELADSSGPLLDVVRASGVAVPGWAFSLVALVAIANGALLTSIMSSRLAYGMADQRLLPTVLSRLLPGRRTPWVAIVATTGLSILLAIIGSLQTLAETVVLFLLVVFVSTNAAALVLRKDRVEHKHFHVPAVVPVLGVISCIVLATQQSGPVWLLGGVLLAIGAVLYLVMRGVRSHNGYEQASGEVGSDDVGERVSES